MNDSAHSTSKPRGLAALASSAPSDGALWRALVFFVAIVAALGTWHAFANSPQRLLYPDSFDYAQMGRQLSRGEGMTSLQVFPYALGWLDAHGHDTAAPWPNIWRFPLPVVARAASFAIFGESDAAALFPALLFSALTAPLLFALANRLGGPAAGLLAAALWIASASQRSLAVTGLSEPGAALLAVAIALLALRARDRASVRASVRDVSMLGVALGLALLHRSNLLALAPLAAWMVWSAESSGRDTTQERLRRLGTLALVALAIAAPWWLRNAALFGEPFLNLTTDRGLLRLVQSVDPFYTLGDGRSVSLVGSLGSFPSQWSVEWAWRAMPRMLGGDFGWLFAAAAVLAPLDIWRRRAGRPIWAMAASALVLTALVFVPLYPHVVRFYWPYAPLLLALVCGSAFGELTRSRGAAFAPATAVAALALFALVAPRENVSVVMPASRAGLELAPLAALVPSGPSAGTTAVPWIASDVSYAVAWQAERPSVRVVGVYDVVREIDARIHPVGAIHVGLDRPLAAPLDGAPFSAMFERVHDDRELGLVYLRRD